MESIRSNADFKKMEGGICSALTDICDGEERYLTIINRVLSKVTLFKAGGGASKKKDTVSNATTCAEFISVYNDLYSKIDGRKGLDMLIARKGLCHNGCFFKCFYGSL